LNQEEGSSQKRLGRAGTMKKGEGAGWDWAAWLASQVPSLFEGTPKHPLLSSLSRCIEQCAGLGLKGGGS
ncbi:MAG: hypothetical protein WBQ89_11545, partial [Candidatus Acidiferrum sp.]